MTAPEKVRSYVAERRRQLRAERRAAREAGAAREIEQAVRAANAHRREVRAVRLPDGRAFPLGAFAGTGQLHPFVPDGATSTSCRLCFGWSSDYRHTSTVWAVNRG